MRGLAAFSGQNELCMDKLRRCAELARQALARGEEFAAWSYIGWIEREARERLYEAEWVEMGKQAKV